MTTLSRVESRPGTPRGAYLEHLFTGTARVQVSADGVGVTPNGVEITFTLTGGTISGPRINGSLRAIGSDWLTIQPHGRGVLDLRIAIETGGGALIYAPCQGPLDLGPDGYAQALRGALPSAGIPFEIAPRFQTSDPGYQWLSDLRCIGLGQVFPDRGEVRCAFYAIH